MNISNLDKRDKKFNQFSAIKNLNKLSLLNLPELDTTLYDYHIFSYFLEDNSKNPEELHQTKQNNVSASSVKNSDLANDSQKIENIKIQELKMLINSQKISDKQEILVHKIDNLDNKDIEFFKFINENREKLSINGFNNQNNQINFNNFIESSAQVSYKSVEVSQNLYQLLEKAYKQNKPVRLDFNKNSFVILKLNKNGKIKAEFVSNDKNTETALKNGIPYLKSKFETQGIPYEEITYKNQQRKNNKNKDQYKQGE